jgi:acyl carrier protein
MSIDERTPDSVGRTVRAEIARRLERERRTPVDVSDGHTLESLGISSIELFDLAGRLEELLGVDPFEQSYSVNDIRTVGDLCVAYYRACSNAATGTDDILRASRRRAETRRRRMP